MIDEYALNIYTDGSSLSSPRRGGIAVRFVYANELGNEEIIDFEYPGYKGATNNEMELLAVIVGLEEAVKHPISDDYEKIIVNTDSQYVRDNIYNAKYIWPKNQWKKQDGGPVLNYDLWKRLLKILSNINKRTEIKWVKGHSKDKHNRAVDKLATRSANNAFNKPLKAESVRRKITNEQTKPGSIEYKGQKITIRVNTCQYLKKQKLYRYRIEVISKTNPFYGKADWVTSKIHLRDGHSYFVKFNYDSKNPMIDKLYREII